MVAAGFRIDAAGTPARVVAMDTAVVVIGGGLTGLSAAYHLRRADPAVRVTVLEREHVGAAASGASAAGVRVMYRDPSERALALASLTRWPDLDRELGAKTGYRRGGGLRIALDAEDRGRASVEIPEQRADGVPVEWVDPPDAMKLAPGIAPACRGGVYCAVDGQADAMATVQAFATAARRLGALVEEGVAARTIEMDRERVVGVVRSDGQRQRSDMVITAAGAWSARLLASVGIKLALQSRALQMLLTEPAPVRLSAVLSAFGRKLSLKQLADGSYLIGGGWPAQTLDDSGNRWAIRADSVHRSLAIARVVYPPLAGHGVARSWAGIEAFGPDDRPYLGPVSGCHGLLVAAGFSGHGFALAPAVGDILARLALGQDALAHLWAGLRADRAIGAPWP
jgi:sarcosine oxidase, subunit beta